MLEAAIAAADAIMDRGIDLRVDDLADLSGVALLGGGMGRRERDLGVRILGFCSGAANDRWNYYLAKGRLVVIAKDLCTAHVSSAAFTRMGEKRLLVNLLECDPILPLGVVGGDGAFTRCSVCELTVEDKPTTLLPNPTAVNCDACRRHRRHIQRVSRLALRRAGRSRARGRTAGALPGWLLMQVCGHQVAAQRAYRAASMIRIHAFQHQALHSRQSVRHGRVLIGRR